MPESFNLTQFLYALEAIALGIVIASGYFIRKWRRRHLQNAPTPFDFGDTIVFELPFAVGSELEVLPYEDFAPGFSVGYEADVGTEVAVSQLPISGNEAQGRYELRLLVKKLGRTRWLSLDREIVSNNLLGHRTLACDIVARSLPPSEVHVQLIVPLAHEAFRRFDVGRLTLQSDFQRSRFEWLIDENELLAQASNSRVRISMLMDLEASLKVDIRSWSVSVNPSSNG